MSGGRGRPGRAEKGPEKGAGKGAEKGVRAVVGLERAYRLLLLAGLPALGLLLGWFVPLVADEVAGLPWAPLQGPFELIASAGWTTLAGPVAGLVLGAGAGVVAVAVSMKVTFEDGTVRVDKDGHSRILGRSEIGAVFRDGDDLVVLDGDSRQLLREKCDADADLLARTFAARGYPWRDEDPHAARYRRWVPDAPELPAGVNAVLKAREKALKGKSRTDAAELHEEAQRLGYVVRDEKTRQYWRPLLPL